MGWVVRAVLQGLIDNEAALTSIKQKADKDSDAGQRRHQLMLERIDESTQTTDAALRQDLGGITALRASQHSDAPDRLGDAIEGLRAAGGQQSAELVLKTLLPHFGNLEFGIDLGITIAAALADEVAAATVRIER